MSAERHLEPAPAPVAEPIPVTLPDGQLIIVEPGQPLEPEVAWLVAYAYREERAARELVEKDIRGKRALIAKLQDEQDAKRKTYGKRAVVERVFDRWRARLHPNAKLTKERFDAVRCRLEDGYEELHLHMAVEGLAAAAYVSEKGERHDDFDVCMRSGRQVERYANKAPREIRERLKVEDETRPGDQIELDA